MATRFSAARLQPWLASMRGIVPWAALGASWTAPGVAVVPRCSARRPPTSLEQIQGGIEDGRRGRPFKRETLQCPHAGLNSHRVAPLRGPPWDRWETASGFHPRLALQCLRASGFFLVSTPEEGRRAVAHVGDSCCSPPNGFRAADRSEAYRWHVRGRGHPPSTSVMETQPRVSRRQESADPRRIDKADMT